MKPLVWIASSLRDLRSMPEQVRSDVGHALFVAQDGEKHQDAKPLKGFGSAGILEIVERYDGDTYRAVYTVKFDEAVYVLHCFQKKSKAGAETPKLDIDLIRSRLIIANKEHDKWLKNVKKNH